MELSSLFLPSNICLKIFVHSFFLNRYYIKSRVNLAKLGKYLKQYKYRGSNTLLCMGECVCY